MKHPLSMEAFLDFARSKDPNEEYDYSNFRICACGQYGAYLGSEGIDAFLKVEKSIPHANTFASYRPYTWGNLVRNIEDHLAKEKENEVSLVE